MIETDRMSPEERCWETAKVCAPREPYPESEPLYRKTLESSTRTVNGGLSEYQRGPTLSEHVINLGAQVVNEQGKPVVPVVSEAEAPGPLDEVVIDLG